VAVFASASSAAQKWKKLLKIGHTFAKVIAKTVASFCLEHGVILLHSNELNFEH